MFQYLIEYIQQWDSYIEAKKPVDQEYLQRIFDDIDCVFKITKIMFGYSFFKQQLDMGNKNYYYIYNQLSQLDRVDVDKIYFISRLLFDIDIDQETVYQYKDI